MPLLFAHIFSTPGVLSFFDPDQQTENQTAGQTDLPAPTEGFVAVDKFHRMVTFRQHHAHHHIAGQSGFRFFSVHPNGPASVLGNGGIEQAVPAVTRNVPRATILMPSTA